MGPDSGSKSGVHILSTPQLAGKADTTYLA